MRIIEEKSTLVSFAATLLQSSGVIKGNIINHCKALQSLGFKPNCFPHKSGSFETGACECKSGDESLPDFFYPRPAHWTLVLSSLDSEIKKLSSIALKSLNASKKILIFN